MKPFTFGITGSFGVGKSTVCRMMQKYGATWIEADAIVHELYKPGRLGYQKIAGYFGQEFIDPKKGVKREKLRSVVLKNPQKLWILLKLIHPLVFHQFKKQMKNNKGIVCLESIYFEKGDLGNVIDKLVEIRRKPELVRKSRVKEGKWNLEDIDRFMKLSRCTSEASAAPAKAGAKRPRRNVGDTFIFPKPDKIIENNSSLKELGTKVHSWLRKFV